MALSDTFVKQVKPDPTRSGGSKHSDGYGLFLLGTGAGKYWRMAYRLQASRKSCLSAPILKCAWLRPANAATMPGSYWLTS